MGPSALVQNVLYFRCATGILEHDLGTQVSEVTRPSALFMPDHGAVLVTTEDGGLGLAVIQQSKLVLWSRETRLDSGTEDALVFGSLGWLYGWYCSYSSADC
jgi:hypothetical protein